MKLTPQELEEFNRDTERIQKIVDEIQDLALKHEPPDVIEALAAVLGTYLIANVGSEGMKLYLDYMLEKGRDLEKVFCHDEKGQSH